MQQLPFRLPVWPNLNVPLLRYLPHQGAQRRVIYRERRQGL
jgi:hypothetical protein